VQEEIQEMLGAKQKLQEETDTLESRGNSIQQVLADLKVRLWAKLSCSVNVDTDESEIFYNSLKHSFNRLEY
jgi:hypothetical protein